MKMSKWYELSRISVCPFLPVSFDTLYLHASPWPSQSSSFPVQLMFLLPGVSASSSVVQELDPNGDRLCLLILLGNTDNLVAGTRLSTDLFVYALVVSMHPFAYTSTCRSSSSSVQDCSYFFPLYLVGVLMFPGRLTA